MTNIEKYLNSVVDYMVRHSKDNNFPFDNSVISFDEYCRQTFGLTYDEVNYVYYRYKTLMGWVSDDDGASQYYLKKILKHY